MQNKADNTKAGFVAIIGKPNAGKSTLMNSIIGEKLAIVSAKPQTTRKRTLGIYTKDSVQIVFTDTPGFLKPRYLLHEAMMGYVSEEVSTADILLVIFDVSELNIGKSPFHSSFIEMLESRDVPKILLLNKIDLIKDKKQLLPAIDIFAKMKLFDEIIPISAIEPNSAEQALQAIINLLPDSPFYYDEEQLSTQSQRFFVSEIIREEIFHNFEDEIPYSTEVVVVEFKERETGKWFISAEIILERNSQKGIIIGKGGQQLKLIGEKARAAIELHLGMPVYLELFVKVREKWRTKGSFLKSFGY